MAVAGGDRRRVAGWARLAYDQDHMSVWDPLDLTRKSPQKEVRRRLLEEAAAPPGPNVANLLALLLGLVWPGVAILLALKGGAGPRVALRRLLHASVMQSWDCNGALRGAPLGPPHPLASLAWVRAGLRERARADRRRCQAEQEPDIKRPGTL